MGRATRNRPGQLAERRYTVRIDTKESYHAVIITLRGKVMGGPDTTKFHKTIKTFIDQKKTHFVVDLGNVSWMSSTGLGMLITGLTSTRNAGGELVVARPTKKIKTLFIVTQLETIFKTFSSVEAAAKSLAP
jgi:anti-sigma B factor antagonist